ncbi:MAG: hypothetical protein O2820_10735 [Planctomycetota bacterium]|nr:hypothetical protein [Planctomycetota bacterium]MDA1249686.1 hypothetical protein [Planctomycetota bacterium]
MKKLLTLTVAAAAAMFMGNVETVQADHCPSGGNSFGGSSFGGSSFGGSSYYAPNYGYSYQPVYSNYGYSSRPVYSNYGYRPSYYGGGNSFGFQSRGLSITFGSGNRGGFGNFGNFGNGRNFGNSRGGHRH